MKEYYSFNYEELVLWRIDALSVVFNVCLVLLYISNLYVCVYLFIYLFLFEASKVCIPNQIVMSE